jgi:hypothetical protein
MMFDIELRARTEGKSSLDDVMRGLWNLCKDDQPGFAQDEIRRQLVRFGGEGMGPLYDQWVLRPGNLPIEQELAKAGLQIDDQGGDGPVIHERANLTQAQSRTLEGWLRTGTSTRMPPPSETPLPAAIAGADTSKFEGDTGRYEIANNFLFVINKDARGLTAGFEDGDKTELTAVSEETFFYARRNSLLTFSRNDQGAVTGILWKQNGMERIVPRVGPFIHSLEVHPDPDTTFTKKVLSVLEALGEGVSSDVKTPGLAPGAWADYCSSGPVRGLLGIRSLDYLDSQSVAGRHIERHHGEVSRINYYKLVTEKKTRYLMVYLTDNGLVTDFDYVED